MVITDTKEVYKDIPGYEGLYQVSNNGNVKRLERLISNWSGTTSLIKERQLKQSTGSREYYSVSLYKKGVKKTIGVHQLVAMAFLNHVRDGHSMVVNHIDNNKSNNKLSNLNVVTQRENCHTHFKGTSKYKGVSWDKRGKKWVSEIYINKKRFRLGYFTEEIDAHKAYQKQLKSLI